MVELVLHEACSLGDYETLEECIKTGKYDPNQRDDEWEGRTALHWACNRDERLLPLPLQALLQRRRPPSLMPEVPGSITTDDKNFISSSDFGIMINALALNARIPGSVECVKILLQVGAAGEARMDGGWTPAHCAAETGRIGALRALHAANVRLDLADDFGDKPLRVAEVYGQRECYKFLESVYQEYAKKEKQ